MEIRLKTGDFERMQEWIDAVLLCLDGAWRHAHYLSGIPLDEVAIYVDDGHAIWKLVKNEARE